MLYAALRSLLDDLRESSQQSGNKVEKLTFQGDLAIGQVGGKLLVWGALKHLTNRL